MMNIVKTTSYRFSLLLLASVVLFLSSQRLCSDTPAIQQPNIIHPSQDSMNPFSNKFPTILDTSIAKNWKVLNAGCGIYIYRINIQSIVFQYERFRKSVEIPLADSLFCVSPLNDLDLSKTNKLLEPVRLKVLTKISTGEYLVEDSLLNRYPFQVRQYEEMYYLYFENKVDKAGYEYFRRHPWGAL